MTNKQKLLKGLLVGASAMTVVMGSATVALAEGGRATTANATLSTGAGIGAGVGGTASTNLITGAATAALPAANANAVWTNSAVLQMDGGGARTVAADVANAQILAIDTANAGGIMTVSAETYIGAISGANTLAGIQLGATTLHLVGTGAIIAQNTANGNVGLALVAGDYSGLAAKAINFTAAGTLVVDGTIGAAAIDFNAGNTTITTGANFGTVSTAGTQNITFGAVGAVGAANTLTAINVGTNAANTTTFANNVYATTVTTATGAKSVFNGANVVATNVVSTGTSSFTALGGGNNVAVTADISGAGTVNFTGSAGDNGASRTVTATTTKGVGTSSAGTATNLTVVATGGAGSNGANAANAGGAVTLDKVATTAQFTVTGGAAGTGTANAGAGVGGAVNVTTTTVAQNLVAAGGLGGTANGGAAAVGGLTTLTGNVTLLGTAASTITGGTGGVGTSAIGGNGGGVTLAGTFTSAGTNGLTITGGTGGQGGAAGGAGGTGGTVAVNAMTIAGGGLTVVGGAGGAVGGANAGGTGGALTFNGAVNVTAGGISITDGAKNGAAAASQINLNLQNFTATAGDITINAAMAGNNRATNLTATAGSVNLTAGAAGALGVAGNVIAGTDVNVTSTANAVTVTGNTTATGNVNVLDSTAATTFTGATNAAGNIVVTNAANAVTFTGATTAVSLNVGAGAGGVVLTNGHTGAASFTGAGQITVATTKAITGAVTTTAANQGTLVYGANANITNAIGEAAGNSLLLVTLNNGGAGITNLTADLAANNVNIATDASTLALGSAGAGKKITGNLTVVAGAGSHLQVYNGANITGTVAAANGLADVTFMESGTFTVGGNAITATNVNFNAKAASTLALTNVGPVTITGNVATGLDNQHSIIASSVPSGSALTITGNAGAAGNALQLIDAGAGTVVFGGTAFVRSIKAGEVDVGNANTNIVYADGGKVVVTNNTTFLGNTTGKFVTNLGAMTSFKVNPGFTATFEDGVNLKAAAITGTGTLTFNGTHAVTGAIGASGTPVAAINVNGAAGTKVTFTDGDIYSTAGINFNGDSTVEISNNIKVGGITTAGAGNGTVIFKNTADVVVDGAIGAVGNALKAVKIAGTGNVTITGGATSASASVVFDADQILTVTGYAGNGGATVTSTAGNTGTVAFTVDATVGIDTYGTADKPLKAIQLAGTKFTVDAASKVFSSITTTKNGASVVDYTVAQPDIYTLGTSAAALAEVKLNAGNYTLHNNVYATDIKFVSAANTDTVSVEAGLSGTFNFGAAGGNLNVTKDTGSIGIVTNSANLGTGANVTFTGSGAMNGQIGAAGAVIDALNFNGAAGKVVTVGADVFATTTTHGAGTVQLANNATFHGAYNVNGGTINVGQKTMTVTGLTTGTGAVTLAVTTDGTVAGTGKLVLGSVDASAATGANTVINVNATTLPVDGTALTILTMTDPADAVAATKTKTAAALAAFDTGKAGSSVTLNINNDFITGVMKGGVITTTRNLSDLIVDVKDNGGGVAAGNVLAEMFNTQGKTLTGDALKVAAELGNSAVSAKDRAGAINSLALAGSEAPISHTTDAAITALDARIAQATNTTLVAQGPVAGASAGDDARSLGAWASAFGGRGTQQSFKETTGFKSTVQGAMVGFDAAINDSTVVGVAASFARTNVKFKDVRAGDKTKATTYLFAGYGVHEFGNNWLVQGSAMMGNSNVTNTAHRGIGGALTATGKFDSMTYATEVLGGYRFNVGDTGSVTPMAGFKFARFSDGAYTETGAGHWNTKVKDTNRDKFEGIIGARASMTAEVENMAITPEFHASMNYDFKAKAPKVDVRLDGLSGSIASKGSKPSKVSWNLGSSVMAKSGSMEYGVGYDASLSNKYIGHQGSLKVRVNF